MNRMLKKLGLMVFALVAAAPAVFAGYMGITKPVPEFEKLLSTSRVLQGKVTQGGQELLGIFHVAQRWNGTTYDYDLNFYTVKKPGALFPVQQVTANLRAEKNITRPSADTLVVDLTGYPSHARSSWKFTVDGQGNITRLQLVKNGRLGFGGLEVDVEFSTPTQEKFDALHAEAR